MIEYFFRLEDSDDRLQLILLLATSTTMTVILTAIMIAFVLRKTYDLIFGRTTV